MKYKFDTHLTRDEAIAFCKDLQNERPDDVQNVTVNYYEDAMGKPFYITFGHYQSGATATFTIDQFLPLP